MGRGPNSAASAWSATRIDPTRSWSSSFTGVAPNPVGIAFVLQGQSLSAIGSPGDGLGYGHHPGSSSPSNWPSVAVEFDAGSFGGDAPGAHVGVTRDGDVTHHLVTQAWPPGLSGSPLAITLSYDAPGHHLSGYLRPVSTTWGGAVANYLVIPVFEVDLDLAALLGPGPVYAGLTGATAGAGGEQSVTSWSYTERPRSLDEP